MKYSFVARLSLVLPCLVRALLEDLPLSELQPKSQIQVNHSHTSSPAQVNHSHASWSCQAAQMLLQKSCEQLHNTKVSCVAGRFTLDFTGAFDYSSLTCVPNNPFVDFPNPGSTCQMHSVGFTKFNFTFSCSPQLTALSAALVVGLSIFCLGGIVFSCYRKRQRGVGARTRGWGRGLSLV